MTRKTKVFRRLPSDAGVTFEGFEKITIPTRGAVKQKLEEFIRLCKTSKKPAIRVLLGEWGEGKTDAYERYIKRISEKDKYHAFFVSASTLANSFEVPHVYKLIQTTSLSAVRFLVALFNCVKEESRSVDIPSTTKFDDAYHYLNEVFKKLIGEEKTRKIFIFIDEFEELLTNKLRLNDIISGIKETINGRFPEIDEGGKFEGCLHLILAATPDAFYQLQIKDETALIFGGLGRRGAWIELPQVHKSEGINFLLELLKYSYEGELSEPLPIKNLGIFNAIFRITQGNPGNIVSLYTRLMNSAKIDDEYMKIIDYEHFLNFLKSEQVFVYGGTTPCLETETFNRELKILEEHKDKSISEGCTLLFKILVGEPKAFNVKELNDRVSVQDVRNYINIINENLRLKENINRAILKVSPLRDGKSLEDVRETFKEYVTMEKDKKIVRIENYLESLEDFEDKITNFDFDHGELMTRIFLPVENYSAYSFFEGISHDTAVELANMVRRNLCSDEIYYVAGDELLGQLYPTPIPRELEFLGNREVRMKLWRDVTKNLANQYDKYMPIAFLKMLEKSNIFKIEDIGVRISRPLTKYVELTYEDLKINTLFYGINGDVNSSDIEDLHRWIKGTNPPVHCAVLLYTGEKTQQAEEKIVNKELGKEGENLILDVHIHPTLAKRIISIYRAWKDYRDDIKEDIFNSVVRRVSLQEINLHEKLRDWLTIQEEKGKIIREIRVESTSNLREFADTLRFFINFMGIEGTTKQIYEKNKNELLQFVKFESRVGLMPDIEFPRFERVVEDLVKNKFLSQVGSKYNLRTHPTENEILKLLASKTKLREDELTAFFVLKRPRYLKDVFIPILDYKGRLHKEGGYFLLKDKRTLSEEVEQDYQKFTRLAEMKKYEDYGCAYITKKEKKDGDRFISLKEFKNFIEGLHSKSMEAADLSDEQVLQKLSLLKRLLEHFIEEFIPLFDKAKDDADGAIINAKSLHASFTNVLNTVKNECNKWLKLEFEIEDVTEYINANKTFETLIKAEKYNFEEIKKIVLDKWVNDEDKRNAFFIKRNEKDACYFNPKLYEILSLSTKFMTMITEYKNTADRLIERFKILNEKQNQIEQNLETRMIDEKYRISHSMLNILKQLSRDILAQIQPVAREVISMTDITQCLEQSRYSINVELDNLSGNITLLDDVKDYEKLFISSFVESKKICDHILNVFDIKDYDNVAKNYKIELQRIKTEYEDILQTITPQGSIMLKETLKGLRASLDDIHEQVVNLKPLINKVWSEFVQECRKFIENIEYILNLLRKKSTINEKEISKHLEILRKNITVSSVIDLKMKLSELEKLKQTVRQKFYEAIKKVVTKKEVQVLEMVLRKTRLEKIDWLPDSELYQIAKSELNIDAEELNDMLEKLVNEQFFKRGISLSF